MPLFSTRAYSGPWDCFILLLYKMDMGHQFKMCLLD